MKAKLVRESLEERYQVKDNIIDYLIGRFNYNDQYDRRELEDSLRTFMMANDEIKEIVNRAVSNPSRRNIINAGMEIYDIIEKGRFLK
jgi:Glu-tRNA(Gln) amidotransferase subunit E-like FAD-binding protein